MGQITRQIQQNSYEIVKYKNAPKFAPAGQSTQMIIGATPDTDFQILRLSEAMYKKYSLKRVFYSAYVPVGDSRFITTADEKPPLLREHRLYQADWLLRFYGFSAGELFSEGRPNLDIRLDPKCDWAIRNLGQFPVEINKADHHMLLRVPGIGVKSAMRIVQARRHGILDFSDLKKIGVVLKRASWFITCNGRTMHPLRLEEDFLTGNLAEHGKRIPPLYDERVTRQMTLFDFQEFGLGEDFRVDMEARP